MDDNSSPSSPVAALRAQFGDRKPPEISRKITACVACRKQKIKCHMTGGQTPCTRCSKRGLPCAVNKSLQMLLESDVEWKHSVEQKLKRLEEGLKGMGGKIDLNGMEAKPTPNNATPSDDTSPESRPTPAHEPQTLQHWEIVMDPDTGPAAIPGSCMTEVNSVPPASTPDQSTMVFEDAVTKGIITLGQAQAYLDVYQNRLDHFLYRIMTSTKTLVEVRQSPLLFAAICAVGSLHLAAPSFERCYDEFVNMAGQQSFARHSTTDDVRALCIAAFWLSGVSWKCVGAAVRIATELQLHRSVFKALQGDRRHYLRTRLYYLLYVADHHHSIPYGRPPMTATDESIRASLQFLESEHAIGIEDDARLVSQVQFWLTGSDVYAELGVDLERPLNATKIAQLRRLSIRFDKIRADWTDAFSRNRFVGNYPKKGVGLHFHFSKLYLYSHAFRGIGNPAFDASDVRMELDELANAAILSATSILRAVATDTQIQDYLNGLPTYFDLMIAFAVVFVLKVSTKYASSVQVNTSEIRKIVTDLVAVLKRVTSTMHPRHLLASVAHGAETLLNSCWTTTGPKNSNATPAVSQSGFDQTMYDMSNDWAAGSYDNFFMGDFDFLSGLGPIGEAQPGLQDQQMTNP